MHLTINYSKLNNSNRTIWSLGLWIIEVPLYLWKVRCFGYITRVLSSVANLHHKMTLKFDNTNIHFRIETYQKLIILVSISACNYDDFYHNTDWRDEILQIFTRNILFWSTVELQCFEGRWRVYSSWFELLFLIYWKCSQYLKKQIFRNNLKIFLNTLLKAPLF